MTKKNMTSPSWTSRFSLAPNINDVYHNLQNIMNDLSYQDEFNMYRVDDLIDNISVVCATLINIYKKSSIRERNELEKVIFEMIKDYPAIKCLFYFRLRVSKERYFANIHNDTVSTFKSINNKMSFKELNYILGNKSKDLDSIRSMLFQLVVILQDLAASYSISVASEDITMIEPDHVILNNLISKIKQLLVDAFDANEYMTITFYEREDTIDGCNLNMILENADPSYDQDLYEILTDGVCDCIRSPDKILEIIDTTYKNILNNYCSEDSDNNDIKSEVASFIMTSLWRSVDYMLDDFVGNAMEILECQEDTYEDLYKHMLISSMVIKIFVYIIETKGGANAN